MKCWVNYSVILDILHTVEGGRTGSAMPTLCMLMRSAAELHCLAGDAVRITG
uniref:Uncharacterized protein n=1 Tax=Anguilla anguilla TaxID=7936 RepID=A0A0E9S3V7_ANGAN